MRCESSAVNCRCVHRSFYIRYRKIVIGKLRRQDIKMQADMSIWCESQDLLWCYLVSAHLHRDNIFSCDSTELWFITEKLSCGNFSKKNCRSFFIACGYGGENASNKSDELKGMKQIEEDFKFTFGTCYGHWYDANDNLCSYGLYRNG